MTPPVPTLRPAGQRDAAALARVLQALVEAGRRSSPADLAFVRARYLDHPHQLACTLARDTDGTVQGFQSLKRADADNPYATPVGWGIIGTHVHPDAARRGVGAALFGETRAAARTANLPVIEAFINRTNAPALAFYRALGFKPWRSTGQAICMAFHLS